VHQPNIGISPRLGISPPWGLWQETPTRQREMLARTADGGIGHLFVADHVSFKGGNGSDGVVHLAALSGVEPRLDLHLGVFLLALRHPVVAARQILTLAEAAPGRLTVGVGVGGEDRSEFTACGIDPATRGKRTDAALDILRQLLDGQAVSWHDEFFELDDVRVRSGNRSPVPLMVGGRSDQALARAARYSDGWLASWCSADRFARGVATVTEAAGNGHGRPLTHGIQLWVGVGQSPEDGKKWVADGLASFYKMPFAPFERYTPCGAAADIADYLAPYVAAGATLLNLTPVGPSREAEIDTMAEVSQLLGAASLTGH
jgi:alkanesulfonate monooxygenase SsuD/methylene tetrahydromethanopterin reductase-like flavin-dependent oxidoreductase (luciferase family)